MAEDKEEDIFALKKPNGLAAYPKHIYFPTGNKYPDGSDICEVKVVNDPDEHKLALAGQKGAGKSNKPEWGK